LLNDGGSGCVFLNPQTQLCTIYRTRPLACRLFDCDGEDRQRLVQLGILPDRSKSVGR
jgi:Fe-S-cluster containining protein